MGNEFPHRRKKNGAAPPIPSSFHLKASGKAEFSSSLPTHVSQAFVKGVPLAIYLTAYNVCQGFPATAAELSRSYYVFRKPIKSTRTPNDAQKFANYFHQLLFSLTSIVTTLHFLAEATVVMRIFCSIHHRIILPFTRLPPSSTTTLSLFGSHTPSLSQTKQMFCFWKGTL